MCITLAMTSPTRRACFAGVVLLPLGLALPLCTVQQIVLIGGVAMMAAGLIAGGIMAGQVLRADRRRHECNRPLISMVWTHGPRACPGWVPSTALHMDGPLDFTTLKKMLSVADGALGLHLEKLETAGYINAEKAFVGRRPKTTYSLDSKGPPSVGCVSRIDAAVAGGRLKAKLPRDPLINGPFFLVSPQICLSWTSTSDGNSEARL